jgi:hypothetical protein
MLAGESVFGADSIEMTEIRIDSTCHGNTGGGEGEAVFGGCLGGKGWGGSEVGWSCGLGAHGCAQAGARVLLWERVFWSVCRGDVYFPTAAPDAPGRLARSHRAPAGRANRDGGSGLEGQGRAVQF